MNTMRASRVLLASAVLLIGVGGSASTLTPVAAITPTPSPTSNQINCAPPLERGPGGQTISAGKIYVTLTAGYNYLWNAPPEGTAGGILRICIIEYFSQITLNADTGAETGRIVAIGSAAPVLDLIAASARLIAPPTPTPAPPPPVSAGSGSSSLSGFGTIRPPNTGDAGLR